MVIDMMWARIEDNRVRELTDIDPEGRFPPGVYNWQPCPDETAVYWAATEGDEGVWSFAPYVPPPPTPEEILWTNLQAQRNLLTTATQSMMPFILALNLDDVTDPTIIEAKKWRDYYEALTLVDLTEASPVWPTPPSDI